MMSPRAVLLIATAGWLGLAGAASAADCSVDIEVGDALTYSVTQITPDASCETVTINLKHTGQLPAAVMGHNWVLSKPGDFDAITAAAPAAGPAKHYVPDDEKVIASTTLVGGGESTSIEVPMKGLSGEYVYFCSFPGHWAAMKGTLTIG
ncbi:MAG: azurin [Pseudomonadota bacterium]